MEKLSQTSLAIALTIVMLGGAPLVLGGGPEVCLEGKGPCCDLDWTGQGATIVKTGGEVMVSQSPYVDATVGMRVNNAGRVMTLDNSFAIVAYDDGCWHEMKANQLLTIEDVSPCCAAAVPVAPPVPPAEPVPLAWIPPAAAAIVGIIALDRDDDGEPPPDIPPPISR